MLVLFYSTPFNFSPTYFEYREIGLAIVNVNTATHEELSMVPYMTDGLENCIMSRRPFKDMADMVSRCGVSEWYAGRLAPYLSFSGYMKVRARLALNSAKGYGISGVWISGKPFSGGFVTSSYGGLYWFATVHAPLDLDVTVGRLASRVPISTMRSWYITSRGDVALVLQKPGAFTMFFSETQQMFLVGNRIVTGIRYLKKYISDYFLLGETDLSSLSIGGGLVRDTSIHLYAWIKARNKGVYSNAFWSDEFDDNRVSFSIYPSSFPLFLGVYIGRNTRLRLLWRMLPSWYINLTYWGGVTKRGRMELKINGRLSLVIRGEVVRYAEGPPCVIYMTGVRFKQAGVMSYIYSLGEHSLVFYEPDGTSFPVRGDGRRTAFYTWLKLKGMRLSFKIGYSSNQKLDFSMGVNYVSP